MMKRYLFRLMLLIGLFPFTGGAQTRLVVFPVRLDPDTDTTHHWLAAALDFSMQTVFHNPSQKSFVAVEDPGTGTLDWVESARSRGGDLAVRMTLKISANKVAIHVETARLTKQPVQKNKTNLSRDFPRGWSQVVQDVLTEILKSGEPGSKPDWNRLRPSMGLDGSWTSYETVMRARHFLNSRPDLKDSVGAMLRRVATTEPRYFAAKTALAAWHRRTNNFDAAIDEYRRALTIDSVQPGIFQAIGDIYFYNKDDLKLARDAYRRELAVSPNAVQALIQMGHTYYIQKEYGQAQTYAKQALGAMPDASPAFNLLGLCSMAMKDSIQAFDYFKKAAAVNALEIPARKNLARWYEQTGAYDDAIRIYAEVIHADPRDAGALLAMANLEYHTGRQRAAVMHYVEAVLYDPDLESARHNPIQILQFLTHNRKDLKAVTALMDSLENELMDVEDARQIFLYRNALGYMKLYYANRPNDAINDLEVAFKMAPSEKRLAFYLGEAYFQIEKYPSSFDYFYSYVPFAESAFNYAKCLQMIGKILIRQNRFEEAQLEILKSLRMYPNAESYFYYGLALRGSQQAEAALAALERAVKLFPQYADAYLELGNTYFALKQYDDALSNLNKAIALDSVRASLHQSVALIHMMKQDFPAAEKEIRTALTLAPRTGESVAGLYGSYGDILLKQQRFSEARGQYELQLKSDSSVVVAYYRIASTYAAGKDANKALTWLETALRYGFTNFGMLDEDRLFDSLRDSKDFNALVGRYRTEYNEKLMRRLKVKE